MKLFSIPKTLPAKIGFHNHDNLLDVNYINIIVKASDLSTYLKMLLKARGIDYNEYNSSYRKDTTGRDYKEYLATVKNPPAEIYEYQNFFLLREEGTGIGKEDGLYLLDGFRRLLWYNAPDAQISVRVYNKAELTDQQILTLMVRLNHFKFYNGSGAYYDRGFALLLRTIFNLNINRYSSAMNGYLSSSKLKNDYSGDWNAAEEKNQEIKSRIVNPNFISDMAFIEAIQVKNSMVNSFMGALLYKERTDWDKPFDASLFLSLSKENKVLQVLLPKFFAVGTGRSQKSQDAVNHILEIYQNIFSIMKGGESGTSYAELKQEAKDLSNSIKKDKGWLKMTGNTNHYMIDNYIKEKIKAGKFDELQFKCVVYPVDYDNKIKLNSGLLNAKVEFIGWGTGRHSESMSLGVKIEKSLFRFRHNWGSGMWGSGGKKYTQIECSGMPSSTYPVDLFVKLTKQDLESQK